MKAWEEFLTAQEESLGKEAVDRWLRTLAVQQFDACNLYLESKDSFQALWFEEHIRPRLSGFLNNNKKPISVHLQVAGAALPKKDKEKKVKKEQGFRLDFDSLDPACTFDSFIATPGNELAVRLLKELPETIEDPAFNPIYIHGLSGSGKTHLLMAVAHALRNVGMKVIYTRAQTFTEHVVGAIRGGHMRACRAGYRSAEVLIVDDVQFFTRKGATQEEFFHTFNALHLDGRQIILSGELSPQELQGIEARLISRFEWGIVAPVTALQEEDREKLIAQKCNSMDLSLSKDAKELILSTFGHNSGKLVRALEALVLRGHMSGKKGKGPITALLVKHYISDLIKEEEEKSLTAERIIETVAEYYGVPAGDILSKSQARECVIPRRIAMHACRQKLRLPYMAIGRLFDRDHSTVMTSVKQVEKAVKERQEEVFGPVRSIDKILKQG